MLPKIPLNTFRMNLISTDKEIELRPFLVKEEKILLIALEGKNDKEITHAVNRIIQNCIITEGIDVEELPPFDVENIFLKLRTKSKGETTTIGCRHKDDSECKHVQKITINLEEVVVEKVKIHSKIIKITDSIGVTMKYATAKIMDQVGEVANLQGLFKMVSLCVDSIYDGDTVYSDLKEKEVTEWLENLSEGQFQKIMEFFDTMPYLKYDVKYKCSLCGKDESYELKGLKDFFI